MLEFLRLTNVGPAPAMGLSFGPRLNLITGDNGLGKSFLLDVAWWALTRKWPQDLNAAITSGYAARPTDITREATISFRVAGKARPVEYESHYDAAAQSWLGRAGRPHNPGLVLYALADGGFAVWDPARNYWKKGERGRAGARPGLRLWTSRDLGRAARTGRRQTDASLQRARRGLGFLDSGRPRRTPGAWPPCSLSSPPALALTA